MEVYTVIRRFGDGIDRRYPTSISGPQDSILTNEVTNHLHFCVPIHVWTKSVHPYTMHQSIHRKCGTRGAVLENAGNV